jgi:hypothetical protein
VTVANLGGHKLPTAFPARRTWLHFVVRDPGFTDHGHTIRYSVDVSSATGPFEVEVELWCQPIGYRWAKNLVGYDADEPRRFIEYYDSMGAGSAAMLIKRSIVSR